MKKLGILSAVTTAITLIASTALSDSKSMEKCVVLNKDGKNIIKEHKSECKTALHSCAGQNPANEKDAWILVPQGQCKKINADNFSGIEADVKDKLDLK